MKEELEICVRAKESFDEVYKKMLDLGFHVQEDFILKDIYMICGCGGIGRRARLRI